MKPDQIEVKKLEKCQWCLCCAVPDAISKDHSALQPNVHLNACPVRELKGQEVQCQFAQMPSAMPLRLWMSPLINISNSSA